MLLALSSCSSSIEKEFICDTAKGMGNCTSLNTVNNVVDDQIAEDSNSRTLQTKVIGDVNLASRSQKKYYPRLEHGIIWLGD